MFLLGGEFVIWCMYREVEEVGTRHELISPPTHRVAPPARNGIVVDTAALVGYHQILIYARDLTVALTLWARSYRIVEREEVFGRSLKLDAVCLET